MKWLLLLLVVSCTTLAHRDQLLEQGFSECEAECIESQWQRMRLKYNCEDHPDLYVAVKNCLKVNHTAIVDWARTGFNCKCKCEVER